MKWVVRSDDLDTLKKETAKHYEKSKYLLVSGFLRYFKTTTILDWAINTNKKIIYVVRTNMTTDESVAKVEKIVEASEQRQLVTLRGKTRICPKIRQAMSDETSMPYELVKAKYCLRCPYLPTRKKYLKKELIEEIESEKVVNTPILDDYYKRGICPAEVILVAAKKFNTIFMTYAWLEFIKDIGKGQLADLFDDALLIMDEARHLEEFGISQKCIGWEMKGTRKLNEIEEIDRILKRSKHFLDRMRKKKVENRKNVDTLRATLTTYRNFIHSGAMGIVGSLDLNKEDIWNSIFFLQNIIVKFNFDVEDTRQALEDALIILLWIHKNINAEMFFDFNTVLEVTGKTNIYLTARRNKEDLVKILDDAGQVFFVDSTPPPLEWTELWLGKKYELDMIEINPKTMPDIRIWVDGVDRRWTKTYTDKRKFSELIYLVTEIVKKSGSNKWTISVRSKLEKDSILEHWVDEDPPDVIYQRGEESEGVQLEGNHIITGLQYQHPLAFNSQRDYVCSYFNVTTEKGKEKAWLRYLNEKAYQSFVQQMFRTYYYKRPCRVILIGVSGEVIATLKSRYRYLNLAYWSVSRSRQLDTKIREVLYLIKTGNFGDLVDIIGEDIKENYQGLTLKEIKEEIEKEYGRISLGRLKVILKKINWSDLSLH